MERNQVPTIRTELKVNPKTQRFTFRTDGLPNFDSVLAEQAVEVLTYNGVQDFDLVEAHLYKHRPLNVSGRPYYELYVGFNTLDPQLTLW